jgi:hypothetical protein
LAPGRAPEAVRATSVSGSLFSGHERQRAGDGAPETGNAEAPDPRLRRPAGQADRQRAPARAAARGAGQRWFRNRSDRFFSGLFQLGANLINLSFFVTDGGAK